MNVMVLPSWYPSEVFPSTGIFFREQAELVARYRPGWKVGISTWGSHDPRLWIEKSRPFDAMVKLGFRPALKLYEHALSPNCVEFFSPAYTWTRRIKQGNIKGIIMANEANVDRFILHFGKPDVFYAHVAYPAGFIAMKLSRKYHVPYVITEHMGPFPFKTLRKEMDQLILTPMRQASAVFAVSRHLADQIRSFGIKAEQTTNFLDDDFFSPQESKQNAVFTFLFIGRLVSGKGVDVLLRALIRLERDCKLKIIGSGPLENQLKRMVKSLNLTNVEWMGECDRVTVKDTIRTCDCLVLPSLHENQPVSILETLACGKPVIGTICGGSEELVNDENGLLAEAGDVADLADKMSRMMTLTLDAEVIRARFLEKHGAVNSVNKLEEIFRSVVPG